MFRVKADSLSEYLDFDPARRPDLHKLHKLIRQAAPGLKRHFHAGTPAGEPGMRFKMIGYGKFRYEAKGKAVSWPVIGVALQKSYISIYICVTKGRTPIVLTYAGKLGALRSGRNNFSFEKLEDLDTKTLGRLFKEVGGIYASDPANPVRYKQGS